MIAILFVSFWLQLTLSHRLIYGGPPEQIVLNAENCDPLEEFVNLPLDHKNTSASTFPNRFYVKAEWYQKGGPVFLYDGGENAADIGRVRSCLKTPYDDLSFFEKFLKDHGGLGIVWEHRYYGTSLPPGPNLKKSKEEDFKYLTTQQALSDVVVFADSFSRPGKAFAGLDLTPKKTPWIFVGCSYPGARAALMRVAHPETIFASYASSAPVQAKVDMSSYWEPIWSGMRKYGYSNCTADMHAAILAIDAKLNKSAADAFEIKRRMFNCTKEPMSNRDFASFLSNLFAPSWQSSGPGPEKSQPGVKEMCDFISCNTDKTKCSDSGGWAKVKGVDFTLDRLRDCIPPSASIRCDKHTVDTKVDDISWKYQYCTEWGYLMVGNPGNSQLVSKYYDLDFFREQCRCQFKPASNGPRAIPDTPKADLINKRYGGLDMRPSRTFWTNGEFDPWSTLSPLKVDNFNIPDYDAPTTPGAPLFGKVLKNKQHCEDFNSRDEDAQKAHQLFSKALKQWLCRYTEKNKGKLNKGAENVLCPKTK
ncbi:hypothetical protein H2200_007365 [Cladophialophora chaetospira]|uniref:Uncharacterized protein n=1 Tax=Cladophialophora chaetospira TaxID=386627 RepID=A0AA38X7N4_9EURO|nr:hypothetical protein H2200_007365 [Cladophialophora chaetospira]